MYDGTEETIRKVKIYLKAGKSAKEIAVLLEPSVTESAIYKLKARHPEIRDVCQNTVTVRWVYPRILRKAA